jgi:gamma-glutamyltranspeptidase/glutathione hydrolase
VFLRDGLPPRSGNFFTPADRLIQRDLARCLRDIAAGGAQAFYEGEFASRTAKHMAEVGGLITEADLRDYRPLEYAEPLHTYRGYEYVTCDSPVIVEALNILENFDLAALGPDSADYRHLVIEALWRAFVDNIAHNGDPSFADVPKKALASKEYARARANEVDMRRASSDVEPGDPWRYEGRPRPDQALGTVRAGGIAHTTQVAAADREGMMISMLTSLGTGFGSRVMIPGTGVLLSNNLQTFDPEPGKPNSLAPGKRPLLIAPAVIMRRSGKAWAGICGSGGRRITGGVLHTVLNLVDFGRTIQPAIEAKRLHTETGDVYIDQEIAAPVRSELAARGHRLVEVRESVVESNFARIVGVTITEGGKLHAGADPLRSAASAGL